MKRLTLLAVLAIAVTAALSSAASASAAKTVLCKKSGENPCAAANVLPSGNNVVTGAFESGESITLKTNAFNTIECKIGILAATSTAESGSPLSARGEGFFNGFNCGAVMSPPPPTCTSFSTNEPPTTITSTGGNNGIVTYGTEAQPLKVSFECENRAFGMLACTYSGSGIHQVVSVEGSKHTATIEPTTLTRVSQTKGTAGCSETATLSMSGRVLLESNKYISQLPRETVLCNKSGENPCAAANVLPSGNSIVTGAFEPGESITLKANAFNKIECKIGILAARSTAESGLPLSAKGEGFFNGFNCAPTVSGSPTCTSFTTNEPPTTITSTGGNNGVISYGTKTQPLEVSFECYNPAFQTVACTYAGSEVRQVVSVEGSKHTATIEPTTFTRVSQTKGLAGACSETGTFSMSGLTLLESNKYISQF